MNYHVEIEFINNNIKKYIKNSEELVIKNETFKIITYADIDTCSFKICIDSQEKIYILNKLLDFLIKHKCFFYEPSLLLFNIDKGLFYKSGYWFLNSEKYWNEFPDETLHYLTLTHNDKVIKHIEDTINNFSIQTIFFIIVCDLGCVDFLVSKCKSELSKKIYDRFIKKLVDGAEYFLFHLIDNYGIRLFKSLRKNNILVLLLDYLYRDDNWYNIIYLSIKTNQTEIIDYLSKYGLEKNEITFSSSEDKYLLISLIENDNIETLTYVIENIKIFDKLIKEIIKESGEFISKEYVDILLKNNKLDLNNLKLLKKSIKNNPDIKLKKYVKKLITNEKN